MFSRLWNWLKNVFTPPTTTPVNQVEDTTPDVVIDNSSSDLLKKGDIFPDISRYEDCDFSVFTGKDMIFKATEGTSWVDPKMNKFIKGCLEKDIRFGVYHFYRTNKDPIAQAQHFIKSVGELMFKSCYHLPVLDYELTTGQTKEDLKKSLDDALKFVQYIYEQTGRKSRIYTGDYLMGYLQFDERFLPFTESPWVAHYYEMEAYPDNTGVWKKLWALQFSDQYYIKGIGECDANYFYGE